MHRKWHRVRFSHNFDWDKSVSASNLMHNVNDFKCGTIFGKTILETIDCCISIWANDWSYRFMNLAQLQCWNAIDLNIFGYCMQAVTHNHYGCALTENQQSKNDVYINFNVFFFSSFICLCVIRCGSIEI